MVCFSSICSGISFPLYTRSAYTHHTLTHIRDNGEISSRTTGGVAILYVENYYKNPDDNEVYKSKIIQIEGYMLNPHCHDVLSYILGQGLGYHELTSCILLNFRFHKLISLLTFKDICVKVVVIVFQFDINSPGPATSINISKIFVLYSYPGMPHLTLVHFVASHSSQKMLEFQSGI